MSAYAEIATTFNDPELVLKALAEMGFKTVESHLGNPQPLQSKDGRFRTRNDWANTDNPDVALKAEIIVRRADLGKGYNDVGFKLGKDGTFSIIPSDFDAYSHNEKWANQVKFNYAEQNIYRAARRQGLRPAGKKVMEDGKLQYAFAG